MIGSGLSRTEIMGYPLDLECETVEAAINLEQRVVQKLYIGVPLEQPGNGCGDGEDGHDNQSACPL